jgi:hypothetical protein
MCAEKYIYQHNLATYKLIPGKKVVETHQLERLNTNETKTVAF